MTRGERTISATVTLEEYRQIKRAMERFHCVTVSQFVLMAVRHMAKHYSTSRLRDEKPHRDGNKNRKEFARWETATEDVAPLADGSGEEIDEGYEVRPADEQ